MLRNFQEIAEAPLPAHPRGHPAATAPSSASTVHTRVHSPCVCSHIYVHTNAHAFNVTPSPPIAADKAPIVLWGGRVLIRVPPCTPLTRHSPAIGETEARMGTFTPTLAPVLLGAPHPNAWHHPTGPFST